MKLEDLVSICLVCQLYSIRNYRTGVTIYKGPLELDDFICQYKVRLVTTQDDRMNVYVDVE